MLCYSVYDVYKVLCAMLQLCLMIIVSIISSSMNSSSSSSSSSSMILNHSLDVELDPVAHAEDVNESPA